MANSDDENRSELSDEDKVEDLDPYPPDRPLGVDDRGVTDVEDSVAERRRREIPSWEGSGRRRDVGSLVDQGDEFGADDEADAVAREAETENEFTRSVQDREEIEPAEEAAMHITADPPMDDDDGYIDER